MPKFYPKYRKKAVPRKRVYKKKTVAKSSVKTMIKKALDRRIENKHGGTTGQLGAYQDGANTVIGSFQLLPVITQGVTESTRVGNTIKMKNIFMKGFLRYNTTGLLNVTPTNPIPYHVRIFIGKLKYTNAAPSVSEFNGLLRTGSSNVPFNSTDGLSLCRKVNTEQFTVYYDKIFKLGTAIPSQTSSVFNVANGISNNDYKLNHYIKINMTKFCKKNFIYDNNATGPTNNGLYMWAGLVDALASDITLGNTPPVVLDFDIEYSFEDA